MKKLLLLFTIVISSFAINAQNITKKEKRIIDYLKLNIDEEEKYRIRRIVENTRRIAEYASDVGEIVLNMNIEKIIKKPKM